MSSYRRRGVDLLSVLHFPVIQAHEKSLVSKRLYFVTARDDHIGRKAAFTQHRFKLFIVRVGSQSHGATGAFLKLRNQGRVDVVRPDENRQDLVLSAEKQAATAKAIAAEKKRGKKRCGPVLSDCFFHRSPSSKTHCQLRSQAFPFGEGRLAISEIGRVKIQAQEILRHRASSGSVIGRKWFLADGGIGARKRRGDAFMIGK